MRSSGSSSTSVPTPPARRVTRVALSTSACAPRFPQPKHRAYHCGTRARASFFYGSLACSCPRMGKAFLTCCEGKISHSGEHPVSGTCGNLFQSARRPSCVERVEGFRLVVGEAVGGCDVRQGRRIGLGVCRGMLRPADLGGLARSAPSIPWPPPAAGGRAPVENPPGRSPKSRRPRE